LPLAFRHRKARLPITKIREVERLAERSIERETDLARECQGKLLDRQRTRESGRFARGVHDVPRRALDVHHLHRRSDRRSARKVCDDCGQLRSWSSNGGVMASQQPILEGPNWTRFRINRIDTASGRTTILTEKPGTFLFAPDLSPDGRWIVFQARPAPVSDFEQLFVAPADENAPVAPSRWIALTDLQHFDANPQWSRDGKMVYFTSNRDGFTCLWAIWLDPVTKGPVGQPFAMRHFHGNPRHSTFYPTYSVGPDRIVISLDQMQSDVWMMHLPEEH
jgi:hypothetical protein